MNSVTHTTITRGNLCCAWRRRLTSWLRCAALLVLLLGPQVQSQAQVPAKPIVDPQIQPASADRAAHLPAAKSVRFSVRAAVAGDQIEQTIAQESQLTTYWRQGRELAKTTTSSGKSTTQRVVTAIDVREGRTIGVQVQYLDAVSHRAHSERPETGEELSRLPVVGKSYRCVRNGADLQITDEQGRMPPTDELEIVHDDMESVGRQNPLAELLGGQAISVGQTIALPPAIARRLLGLSDQYGELTKFELRLKEIRAENGSECAVFHASIEAASNDSSQLRLILSGPLIVQVNSCRAVQMNLSGPIAMSESRGSLSASYQLISTGRLTMTLSSQYRDAKR
jgi:hypothetical protein